MPRSTRSVLAVCICLASLTTVGCGQATGGIETDGLTLTIHVPDGDERQLGPSGAAWFLVFMALVVDPEGTESYRPRLLDRWDHTPDYTQWTLHVREGMLWGDGVPVTAEDVKFSLELWTDIEVGYEYRFFETITVLDSHTLQITARDPLSGTIFRYNWLPMVPKHLLEDLDLKELFSWRFWVEPVGNGPFRYVRHTPGVMTELEANPGYSGERPDIQTVVLQYGGNGLTELLSGNVDIATEITPLDVLRLAADPRFRIYHDIQHDQQVAIAWNHRNPLFRDAAVRRALTMAIDRRELHRLLNYPDDLAIVDVPAETRHHLQGMLPTPLPFDPERASRLFASEGWMDTDGDGILDRDGQDFQFTLLTSAETAAEAVYIQDQFRRVGIRMEISTYERIALIFKTRDHDFDAAIRMYNDIEGFGEFPISGYENSEVSRLRDAARFTIDRDDVDRYMQDLWQIVGEEIPITFLHPLVRYFAAHRRVQGLHHNSGQLPAGTAIAAMVEHLWIDDEAGEPNE